jgi:hypothetical protein
MDEKSADDIRRGSPTINRGATSRGPLIPVPVPIGDQHRRKQAPGQGPSLWLLCSRWIRYHSIQWRWDIERFLARRFNRRWGGL